ncbi:hypothetical protein [Paenibacillus sp. V4I5]|nr:hypothetical protein [Paenibacillus sp. V4I5]MDQ0915000.1 hypothetical protein [Paenibacillus sp. V4I5]
MVRNNRRLKWILGTAMTATLFVNVGSVKPEVYFAKAEAKPEASFV